MTPLVCCRVADMTFVPSAAVFDRCRACGERVAYSPASAKLVAGGQVPMCDECFATFAAGKIVVGCMNAEQIADQRRAEEERVRASN